MSDQEKLFNNKQIAFKELFVGTFIYAVVLGFFNDYTSIVTAKSFSTIFYASVVLEILTFLAFSLKSKIVKFLKNKQGLFYKIILFFSVWLVMFLSKFVFIGAIDFIFSDYININGFFGILFVALAVTVIHKLADTIFIKLANK